MFHNGIWFHAAMGYYEQKQMSSFESSEVFLNVHYNLHIKFIQDVHR